MVKRVTIPRRVGFGLKARPRLSYASARLYYYLRK